MSKICLHINFTDPGKRPLTCLPLTLIECIAETFCAYIIEAYNYYHFLRTDISKGQNDRFVDLVYLQGSYVY